MTGAHADETFIERHMVLCFVVGLVLVAACAVFPHVQSLAKGLVLP